MTTSTTERILEAAAEERAAHVQQRSHRPQQRRSGEEPGTRPAAIVRAQTMQIRAAGDGDGERLHFEGFASVYDRFYDMWDAWGPYDEQVVSGAGKNSLAREDLDLPLVLQHEALRRIARTTPADRTSLIVTEQEIDGDAGLFVDAPKLNPADPDVAYIAQKLVADGDTPPLIDEMSFRFRIIRGQWSADYMSYSIEEYDIHRGDVAIVAYGANPYTQGAGLRAAKMPNLSDLSDDRLRQLEKDLHAERQARAGEPPSRPMTFAQLAAIDGMNRP